MAGVGDCERQEGGECGWTITRCPDLCEMIQCERGAMCVEGECVDDPDRCVPGEQVPAGDGCNTCVCPESGLTAEADDCTLAVCENDCRADADCPDAQYCDFPNDDCGVFGGAGTCRERTNDPCPPGGVGACGCNGDQAFNGCDLSNAGTDINRYGGCLLELIGAEGFLCGHMNCDAESEYCYIAMNDVAGPNEPDFFARCEPLPAGCEQGDCDCLGLPEFPQFECYDDNGYSIAFDPGG